MDSRFPSNFDFNTFSANAVTFTRELEPNDHQPHETPFYHIKLKSQRYVIFTSSSLVNEALSDKNVTKENMEKKRESTETLLKVFATLNQQSDIPENVQKDRKREKKVGNSHFKPVIVVTQISNENHCKFGNVRKFVQHSHFALIHSNNF